MTHGLDTSFLVAAEVAEHVEHAAARARLKALREAGDSFALTPQVLAEFVHVVTDAKRFSQPLAMNEALDRAEIWWNAPEIDQVTPAPETIQLFLDWMRAPARA
jgi:predicted nucleic acid-binding protein